MVFNWPQFHLGDICIKIGSGATPKGGKEFYQDIGIPLIRSQNVLDFSFSISGLAFISNNQAAQLDNVIVNENDVLINITGDSVARVCLAPKKHLPARVNQHVAIIRPNPELAESKYILYVLQFQKAHFLSIAASGGTRNALTKKMLEDLQISLPPLSIQRSIAATLSCLDDKIELNNRINANLEAQAQAIFKSWFVDFEPFRDGEFVDSELGKIPKGWNVGKFTNIVNVLGGGTPKTDNSEYWNGNIPFFTPKDADNIYVFDTEKYLSREGLKNCNSPLYPVNTVFITARGTVGKLALAGFDMAMNQSCYALIGKTGYSQQFTYGLAVEIIQLLKHKSSGAVFDAIVTRDFDSEFVVIPPCDIVQEYTAIVTPLHSNILLNTKQSHTLAAIRDTLLPKLMSGEIATDKIVQGGEKSAKIRGTI